MGKVNNVWNHYFKDKRRFADLFNGIYFQGKKVICAEDLLESSEVFDEVEAEKQERLERGKRIERIRDVIMVNRNGVMLCMMGIENQNIVDYTMPFRCMQYDTMEYSHQLNELRRENEVNDCYVSNVHIPAKQHNRPEGTACRSASNCMIAVCV